MHIDKKKYIDILTTDPLWHITLHDDLHKYFHSDGLTKEEKQTREDILHLVMQLFDEGKIILGSKGMDLDKGRKEIDTIVIHHSGRSPNETRTVIECLILLRLYAKYYADSINPYYKQPIWSGHFYNDKMSFIPYHYLVYPDGSIEHILKDNQLGWQAGNSDINSRSIAICFFDELEHKRPTEESIDAAKDIISKNYSNAKVLGHLEVNPNTDCPGEFFLGVNGWKNELLAKSI